MFSFIPAEITAVPSFPVDVTYVVVRPTFEFGEFTVTARFEDYEEVQLRFGSGNRPSEVWEFFPTITAAVEAAAAFRHLRPNVSIWFDGHELLTEITDYPDLVNQMAQEL
jgi:hypothetical protein